MTSRRPRAMDDSPRQAEQRRQAPVALVQCAYRLAKACQLYDDANQTVQQLVQPLVDAVALYCEVYGTEVIRVAFSRDKVTVNRRMLRTSREAYALALQVGGMLEPCGTNELTFERGVGRVALLTFFRLLVDSQRDHTAAARLLGGLGQGISTRKAPDPDAELDFDPTETPVARVVKSYATAIVVVRAFHDKLAHGDTSGGREVKRIAQKLVALVEDYPEWLTAAAAGPLDEEPAKRAVSTAVLSLAMATSLTHDRAALGALALAALTADCGQGTAAGSTAAQDAAAQALIVLLETGQFYPPAIRRNVIVYEALEAKSSTAPIYEGLMTPASLASLLFAARRFNELRSARRGARPVALDQAVERLDQECTSPVEHAFVRLLTVALGFIPPGTIVELDTGEIGTVIAVPKAALDFARPRVRIVADPSGNLLAGPFDIDLSRQPDGMPKRSIQRVGATPAQG